MSQRIAMAPVAIHAPGSIAAQREWPRVEILVKWLTGVGRKPGKR
jgi:hypothetical protein